MATPADAPYKLAQRAAASNRTAKMFFRNSFNNPKPVRAVRDGKLNKKSGRRLSTAYK